MVLLWWREDDGDLGDALIDARGPLEEDRRHLGADPEDGQPGHVEPSEIAEAVPAVGLAQTAT